MATLLELSAWKLFNVFMLLFGEYSICYVLIHIHNETSFRLNEICKSETGFMCGETHLLMPLLFFFECFLLLKCQF